MSDFWLYALLIAVVIIIALAFYAGKLLRQLAQQKEQQAQILLAQQEALNTHDKKVFDSVLLITRAMQQEQCEFDEGCWRLSVLLSSLKTLTEMPVKFPGIFGLYDAIKDLAIRDARKTLTKKERMREDYQRMIALDKRHDEVVNDLGELYQFTTEQLNRLTP
ncbi:DUF2489 domain-containing protein [Colwellia psychrerythraea]|uniref:DUF2489 domain-containing protein n=1 Tax=Colwellia psychrerythraea TaxID=28229 RepID=A0A099KN98_COLPS|nr:DUF2489 domain-containing protein [Colwellia psychrerythraea]KGJ92234.1 protein of unknown function DUF2489-containing protein [Colwellia psychrerythraea]